MLFSRFGINYNNLPLMFRKGSTLLWETENSSSPALVAEVRSLALMLLSYSHEAQAGHRISLNAAGSRSCDERRRTDSSAKTEGEGT